MRIGSLCSGYGGLELGVHAVLGGEIAFQAEIDPAASEVLATRFPGIPNLGNLAEVDWKAVMSGKPQIDLLTAGFPLAVPGSEPGRHQARAPRG